MTHFKPDPEFNPYAAPQSDFETNPETEGPNYAKFSRRVYAFLLDSLICYALMFFGNFFTLFLIIIPLFSNNMDRFLARIYLSYGIMTLPFLYFALQERSVYQATIGKRIMGIKVTNLEGGRIGFGQATGRFFSKIPSAFFFFLGFLMQPFTAKKQAFHDILAGTLVIDTRE